MEGIVESPVSRVLEAPELLDRLVVHEYVYLRETSGNTECLESCYIRELETDEQFYQRRITVGEEWTSLDCGWLQEPGVSVIHIQNAEGLDRTFINVSRIKREVKDKIIEVSHTQLIENNINFYWEVKPTETFKGFPNDVSGLVMRCRSGKAKVVLSAFPK